MTIARARSSPRDATCASSQSINVPRVPSSRSYGLPNLIAAGLGALGLGIALISGGLQRRDAPHPPTPLKPVLVLER